MTSPNPIWVSDLTYLRTLTGFAYLAVVLDLYSRRVVGWKVSQDVDAGVVLEALRRALAVRPARAGMIHHSDRQGVRGRIRRTRRELQQVGGPMGDKSSPMFGWCRCAAIFAIVCSIAACVPPNPGWSSSDPAGQSAEPEESASTYENEGDGVAEDDDAEDAPSTAADRDQAGSTTARSYAPPGKTCAAACRRFSDCKLFSFEPCMEECGKQGAEGTAEGRRTNLVQARSSCNSLAAGMAPSDWVCIAEGESVYGYDVESATGDVQGTSSVHLAGQGKTRADAQYSAISNCHSMMTVDLNRNGSMNLEPSPQGSWGSAISSPCHITQCYAPARARRGKSSSR